jgi:hypothetical protein
MLLAVRRVGQQLKVLKPIIELVLILVMQHEPDGHQVTCVLPPHQMVQKAVAVVVSLAGVFRRRLYALVEFELGHSSTCNTFPPALAARRRYCATRPFQAQ